MPPTCPPTGHGHACCPCHAALQVGVTQICIEGNRLSIPGALQLGIGSLHAVASFGFARASQHRACHASPLEGPCSKPATGALLRRPALILLHGNRGSSVVCLVVSLCSRCYLLGFLQQSTSVKHSHFPCSAQMPWLPS